MNFLKNLLSKPKELELPNYFSTHKIGGLHIDVEGIIDNVNVNFEGYSNVSYLRNLIINNGESKFPEFDDYVVVLSKVGIINNDQLVLKTKKSILPVIYYDLRDARDYVTHSLLGHRYTNDLINSPMYVYNGLNGLI